MSTKEKLEQLKQKRAKALLGGGQDKIDKIHAKGKKTAREPRSGPARSRHL